MPSGYGDIGKKQGGGDPNIMKLKDVNKVRPLDNVVAGWRQHGVEHPSDPEQFASVVCPGARSCPLDRKPVDAQGKQRFPISRRYAANVWDYGTNSVKVLVAGPAIFDQFKEVAQVGIDPSTCDWTITKSGQGIQTKYSVIRHEATPFTAAEIKPEMLHSVDKYEQPTSTEAIFEILERFGIDYDALETPSYTLDQALAFVMPYTKHKGLTIEQLLAKEPEYAEWMHSTKLEQGQLGDPVFLALQVAMEERGLVPPLEDALSQFPSEPQAAAVDVPTGPAAAAPSAASAVAPGSVQLVNKATGELGEYPEGAASALLATGLFEPYEPPVEAPAPPASMIVLIGGNQVELPTEQAQTLIDAGQAQPVNQAGPEPEPEPPKLPLPDEVVNVEVGGVVVQMPYVQAALLVDTGPGEFPDPDLQAAHDRSQAGEAAAKAADPSPTSSQSSASTASDPDKPFRCPDCGRDFKTQGALTQHAKKEHKAAEPQPSAIPVATNGGSLKEEVKGLVARAPFARDFDVLLKIMEEETGGTNFEEMNEAGLTKLKARLEREIAAAAK